MGSRLLPVLTCLAFVVLLSSCIDSCVDMARAKLERCKSFERSGDLDLAYEFCEQAVESDPGSPAGQEAKAKLPALAQAIAKAKAKAKAATARPPSPQDLPALDLDVKQVDGIQIEVGGEPAIGLAHKEGGWELVAPLSAPADQKNVKALLENLSKLAIADQVSSSAADYGKYWLAADKAVHLRARQGDKTLLDVFFGKSDVRGQMMRIAGKDGVFVAKGYSDYLYKRDLKSWRDRAIWSFGVEEVTAVQIDNAHGKLRLARTGGSWKALSPAGFKDFEPKKIDDLLRVFKNLQASDFGASGAETGLDEPTKHGGVVRIERKGEPPLVLQVGHRIKGTQSRYARREGAKTVYIVSTWAGSWAIAKAEKLAAKK